MRALTANRLVDGEVVFWNGGQWVEQFDLLLDHYPFFPEFL